MKRSWQTKINHAVMRICRRLGPFDCVILGRESFLWNLEAVKAANRGPVMLICRGAYINHLIGDANCFTRVQRRLITFYKKVDIIVCVAGHLVRSLCRISGRVDVRFIPNPIQLPTARPARTRRSRIVRLVMAAQLKRRKRPLDALRILARCFKLA